MQKTNYFIFIIFFIMFSGNAYSLNFEDDGFRREYYDSGKILSETNCFDEDDDGVYREYYENGKLKMEVHYKAGQYEGVYRDYCEDGTLHVKFEYKNNKRDGLYKLYYNSGALEAEGLYKDGKEVGVHNVYYENGQLAAKVTYQDGREDGIAKTYYEDGKVWEEFSYKNGIQDGEYREYYPNGYVKRKVVYDGGQIVRSDNYDEERKLLLQVLRESSADSSIHENQIGLNGARLRQCVSELLGVEFLCDPQWKLQRGENFLKITISSHPEVMLVVEETNQKIDFMSQLSRQALDSLGRYAEGYAIERLEYCDRETVKVKGYAKDNPNIRLTDYYLADHLRLHTIRFSIEPKESFEDYKFLIKEVADSFVFKHQGKEIKFSDGDEDAETCLELIP